MKEMSFGDDIMVRLASEEEQEKVYIVKYMCVILDYSLHIFLL